MSNVFRFVSTGAASTYYVALGHRSVGIASKRGGMWRGIAANGTRCAGITREHAAQNMAEAMGIAWR
jgi:hypothetical protein